jgi:hypothetical protein
MTSSAIAPRVVDVACVLIRLRSGSSVAQTVMDAQHGIADCPELFAEKKSSAAQLILITLLVSAANARNVKPRTKSVRRPKSAVKESAVRRASARSRLWNRVNRSL